MTPQQNLSEFKSIDIVGAGGIGVAMAYALQNATCPVRLVEKNVEKISAAKGHISIAGKPPVDVEFIAFDQWSPTSDTVVLLCCKTYDNHEVLARLTSDIVLIPVQNGFDLELDNFGHGIEGISSFVSECERDRPLTRITRPGELHLGPRRTLTEPEQKALAGLQSLLADNELFPVINVDNVLPYKATKLMYNAAISPLAAAAGVDNGELLTNALAKKLFFKLIRENYAILNRAKLELATIGPFHPDVVNRILRTPGLPSIMAMFFRPSLRGTYCSMAPDIGTSKTEIEAYNGHLIRLAGDYPCPINRAAYRLIKKIVAERLPATRAHLEELKPALAASLQ